MGVACRTVISNLLIVAASRNGSAAIKRSPTTSVPPATRGRNMSMVAMSKEMGATASKRSNGGEAGVAHRGHAAG